MGVGIEDQGMGHAGAERLQAPEAAVCTCKYGARYFENVDFDTIEG